MAEMEDEGRCQECGHEHTAPDGACRCGCQSYNIKNDPPGSFFIFPNNGNSLNYHWGQQAYGLKGFAEVVPRTTERGRPGQQAGNASLQTIRLLALIS